jgi:hypothetical protein
MNFQIYANKEYLEHLAINKPELQNMIEQSQGYILNLMKEFDVLPELSLLLDSPSIYALSFIENNYILDLKNKKTLTQLLKSYSKNNTSQSHDESKLADLTEAQIIKHLVKGIKLPYPGFKINPAPISAPNVNKYLKEIKYQYEINSGIKRIMTNSIDTYSIEEILSLDRDFILETPDLMNLNSWSKKQYMQDPRFARLYRDVIFHNHPEVRITPFFDYYFNDNEEDKALFDMVMNNTDRVDRPNYTKYQKIKGNHHYYDKEEYIKKFSPYDITDWTQEEMIENKDLLKDCWEKIIAELNANADEKDGYVEPFKLYEIIAHMSPVTCQKVFDKTIVEFLLQKKVSIFFDWDEEDDSFERQEEYSNAHTNQDWLEQQMFEILNEKPELMDKEMAFSWGTAIDMTDKENYLSEKLLTHCLSSDNLASFMRYTIDYKKDIGFQNIEEYKKFSNYYPGHGLIRKNATMIDEMIENNPSVNLLFFLMNELAFKTTEKNVAHNTYNNYQKLYEQNQKLASLLPTKEVALMVEFFSSRPQLSLPIDHGLQGTDNEKALALVKNGQNNFFNHQQYKPDDNMKTLLLFTSPDYQQHLLSDTTTEELSDNVLLLLLNQLQIKFLKNYMQKHPELLQDSADNSFIAEAKKLPFENQIFQWDEKKIQNQIDYFFVEYEKIINLDRTTRYKQKEKWDSHRDMCSKLLYDIPHHHLKKMYKKLIEEEQFFMLNHLREDNLSNIFPSSKLIAKNYLESQSASNLIRLFDNKQFFSFIYNLDKAKFSYNYNQDECFEIAKKMIAVIEYKKEKSFSTKKYQNESEKGSTIARYFEDNQKGFLNDFITTHLPLELWQQNYDYFGWSEKYPLTGEHLIRAYENSLAKEEAGEYSKTITINMLAQNIEKLAQKYLSNEQGQIAFNQFLDYARNNDSMLYAVLSDGYIYSIVYKDSQMYGLQSCSSRHKNWLENVFYKKDNEDYAILIDGYQKILQQESYLLKHTALYKTMETLDNLYSSAKKEFSISLIDREKTQNLVDMIYQDSPLLILDKNSWCGINLDSYRKNWIENNQEKFIDSLLFHHEDLPSAYCENKKDLIPLLEIVLDYQVAHHEYYQTGYLAYLFDTAQIFKKCAIQHDLSNNEIVKFFSTDSELMKKIQSTHLYLKLNNQVTSEKNNTEDESCGKLKI